MRLRAILIICLFFLCLLYPGIAGADLSVTNKWRIEQSANRCRVTQNALSYPDYWGESVSPENLETVCMAEQFAQLAVSEGDQWLENKAVEFIRQCREKSSHDTGAYHLCLEERIKEVARQLSEPCRELGREGLWDEGQCRRLVSYIFVKDFNEILRRERPLIEKLMGQKVLRYGFSPVAAFIFLILYVLDLVLFVDPGHWARVPKFSCVVGAVILGSWFLHDELRFVGMGAAVIGCLVGMFRNHVKSFLKPDKKKGKR